MIYRHLHGLLSFALLCCLWPVPTLAADHDPTGVELTPSYLALFNGAKGWAPLKEGGLRALDSQDPANPFAADTLSLTLERSRPKEGVATLVFRTYARDDSAREAFAKDWRWRYDNHVVPSGSAAPFVRSVHEASADGRILAHPRACRRTATGERRRAGRSDSDPLGKILRRAPPPVRQDSDL
jgi:hypothetical protein